MILTHNIRRMKHITQINLIDVHNYFYETLNIQLFAP